MAKAPGVLPPDGAVAVIFVSLRREVDEEGYGRAAAHMVALSAKHPGCLGLDSVRGPDGLGITVSYFTDEDSAIAWRNDVEHVAIRALGRKRWYAHYRLIVSQVTRSYDWAREEED